ncbi:MAG: DUF5317 family protein [Dehalococcoidia bacterium]|nr:DUF5317 family protein [Dehalococcoidia bacterium]
MRIVVPATIAAVPVVLWPHRRHAGVWVIFVGMAANLAVVLANGGLMPIERQSVVAAAGAQRAERYAAGAWINGSKDVLVTRSTGRAVALGDSLVVGATGRGIVASPGDVVILVGLLVLAGEAAVGWRRRRNPEGGAPRGPRLHEAGRTPARPARPQDPQPRPASGARGSATTPQ